MAKEINKLTDAKVKKLQAGFHADGQGLFLNVTPGGSRSWVTRVTVKGKIVKRGLGSYPAVSLSEARKLAKEAQAEMKSGVKVEPVVIPTFKQCATDYIEAMRAEWSNAKHEWQWTQSLEKHAYPVFGDLPVDRVDTDLVLNVLRPIWATKTETATRVRQRIEAILAAAKVLKYRDGENPAVWKNHLDKILPKPTKVTKVVHHPALSYSAAPEFYLNLKAGIVSHQLLRLIILTATRFNESRGAEWAEFDMVENVWTIPPERVKTREEFRIPITDEMIKLLDEIQPDQELRTGFLFPSPLKPKQAISDVSVRKVLHRDYPDVSIHGFRSCFRDWAAEQTNYPHAVCEAALNHKVGNKVTEAYKRTDYLDKRRLLLQTWHQHLCQTKNK
jgi:integrase